ncbi:Gfo/Idh/MocA family protein [Jatrophihabitans fulvus]
MSSPVRWGVLGTAKIARSSLLPAVAAAGGVAHVVGSRSPERAQQWARESGVGGGTDYEGVLADPDVDVVYVALPNDQHVEWALKAAAAGKAVLCEKPLGLDAADVTRLVDTLEPAARVWEAFVFPFHPQSERVAALLTELGEPLQVVSEFHFTVSGDTNIRLNDTGGGALYDVGCYPVRLGRLLLGSEPTAAHGSAVLADNGIDLSTTAVLDFPGDRRLVLSCSLQRPASTATRIIGSAATLEIDNPFHPKPGDAVRLVRRGEVVETIPADERTAFTHAVTHVQDVVRGAAEPRHTVPVDGLAQSVALDLVRRAVGL